MDCGTCGKKVLRCVSYDKAAAAPQELDSSPTCEECLKSFDANDLLLVS